MTAGWQAAIHSLAFDPININMNIPAISNTQPHGIIFVVLYPRVILKKNQESGSLCAGVAVVFAVWVLLGAGCWLSLLLALLALSCQLNFPE